MINRYQKLKLIHQIGLIILLGFGMSFLLSLYLLSSEKTKSLNFLSSSGAIQRVISVASILSQTPEQLHPSILRASSSSDLALSLSPVPRVAPKPEISHEERNLIERLNSAGLDNVHLSLITQTRPMLNMNDMHNAMMSGTSMREMRTHRIGYVATIDGSVQVGSGVWLNFSSGVQEEITHWSTGLLLSLLAVVLATILLSLFIIQRALSPVRALGRAARDFALNRKGVPVSTECASDLQPAIQSFNDMQAALSGYMAERAKLLAAISHDLRTPLTSLRLRLEFIEDGEDKQQMLRTMGIMEKMLLATMSFAKDDSHQEERQLTDVNSLIQSIVDEYEDKDVHIAYQQTENLIENVPPVSIRRMVENLVNNSVQYAGESSTITIQVAKHKRYLEFSVRDTGTGIARDKLEEVIKPFTRLDPARDTDSSNVGLGLSITKSLANAYGGTLTLTENMPHGLICTFTIEVTG